MARDRIEAALTNMAKARSQLKDLLADIQPDEWYARPGGVTNIAWQAGHLAATQYALCLVRVRGKRADDARFFPPEFAARYGKGTTPSEDPDENASADLLLSTLDAVDAHVRKELSGLTDADLAADVDPPHPRFKTKLDAVSFCPLHEMMHAGQVVLLRRLLGREARF